MVKQKVSLAVDILYGAKSIAAYMGCSVRFVYYLRANTNVKFIGQIGSTLVSKKSEIDAYFDEQTSSSVSLDPANDDDGRVTPAKPGDKK